MSVNRERKLVDKEQESACFDGCSLKEVLVRVTELISTYSENAFIDNYTYPYSDGAEHQYVWTREPESDEKMAERIAYEERWEAERVGEQRRMYEQLKKQFDGS